MAITKLTSPHLAPHESRSAVAEFATCCVCFRLPAANAALALVGQGEVCCKMKGESRSVPAVSICWCCKKSGWLTDAMFGIQQWTGKGLRKKVTIRGKAGIKLHLEYIVHALGVFILHHLPGGSAGPPASPMHPALTQPQRGWSSPGSGTRSQGPLPLSRCHPAARWRRLRAAQASRRAPPPRCGGRGQIGRAHV